MTPPDFDAVQEFRKLLAECKEFYHKSAFEIAEYYPELLIEPPREFMNRMLDLHRGLLIKVFVTIAYADSGWTPEETELAAALFEHLWGEHLKGEKLQEALNHILEQQADLRLESLVSPFQWMAPLREYVGELETLILRLANLVAKADGQVSPQEVRQL
jgi:tellurite resistance protein